MNNLAVAYLRVSTDEQGDSQLGLSAQLSQCKAFCKTQDINLIEHRSEVISGKIPLQDRPIFLEARNLCMYYPAILIVAKQDRLSRDELIWHSFVSSNTFGKIGTPKLIIADNPNATLFELSIRAAVAAEERRNISERTKAAMQELKKKGVNIGEAGRKVAHSKFIDTSDAWQIILMMKSEGFNSTQIANYLNENGYTNAMGRPWRGKSINARFYAVRKESLSASD